MLIIQQQMKVGKRANNCKEKKYERYYIKGHSGCERSVKERILFLLMYLNKQIIVRRKLKNGI